MRAARAFTLLCFPSHARAPLLLSLPICSHLIPDPDLSAATAAPAARSSSRAAAAAADAAATATEQQPPLRAANKPTPLLGVNSSPGSSVGFLCAARRETFPTLLQQMLNGEFAPLCERPRARCASWRTSACAGEVGADPVWRARVLINGLQYPVLALNDVLVAANSPAAVVRCAGGSDLL